MTTKDEALQQALDALGRVAGDDLQRWKKVADPGSIAWHVLRAIATCREALARKAGFEIGSVTSEIYAPTSCEMEMRRFAELVAAAEREACAKLMDDMAKQDKHSNYYKVAAKAIRARGEA